MGLHLGGGAGRFWECKSKQPFVGGGEDPQPSRRELGTCPTVQGCLAIALEGRLLRGLTRFHGSDWCPLFPGSLPLQGGADGTWSNRLRLLPQLGVALTVVGGEIESLLPLSILEAVRGSGEGLQGKGSNVPVLGCTLLLLWVCTWLVVLAGLGMQI